jgi:nitrogen fixation/metabolism regulation signal transduction histidine kinase
MRIQFKLILVGFVVIAVLMGVVGFVGIKSTSEVAERFDEIADETTPALLALGKIETTVNKIQAEAISFALVDSEVSLIKVGQAQDKLEKLANFILSEDRNEDELLALATSSLVKEEGAAAAAAAAAEISELEEAKEELEFWEDEFAKVAEDELEQGFVEEIEEHEVLLFNAAVALVNAKQAGEQGQTILDLKEKLEKEEDDFEEVIERIIEHETNDLLEQDKLADAAAAAAAAAGRILAVGVVASVLLALGMGIFVSRSVARPLKELQHVAAQIIAGDYSVRAKVNGKDEIAELGEAFNAMTDSLVESKRLPENILRSMRDSLFVVDTKGNITEVNDAGLEVLGYKKEELVGAPISKVFGGTRGNSQKLTRNDAEESAKKKVIRYVPDETQPEEDSPDEGDVIAGESVENAA